ncbi:YczE/YyaS/YitT family protein [Lapidilactobacillus luobeiensis]|uniref:YczE/YyaS/YitT family protein n=1 Tax=Lapidilactobacillus luobeiensis TaxID=2950371 RepID=UPI0021C45786|nr:hypothetical protein [Lapidilactobacillus luobeiensis]
MIKHFLARLAPQGPKNYFWRSLMSFIGVTIQAIGATLLLIADLGMDPYSATNVGLAKLFQISLGTYQLSVNFVILIFVFIMARKLIGTGTIFNMVLIGYYIQLFNWLYKLILPGPTTLITKILVAVIGLLIFTFGVAAYITADTGVAPYDAITPILVTLTHGKYRIIRITQDVLFTLGAYFVGGPVGIVTIIVAFFTGPLIVFWDQRLQSLINWIDLKTALPINNSSSEEYE